MAMMYDCGAKEVIILSLKDGYPRSPENEPMDGLQPMGITIHKPTKVVKHPVETGGVVMDNKVIMPQEITVSCYVHTDAYSEISGVLDKFLLDRTGEQLINIRTKTRSFPNMILYDYRERQTKDKYDVVAVDLKFVERMDVTVDYLKGSESSGGKKNVDSTGSDNAKADQNKGKKMSGYTATHAVLALMATLPNSPIPLLAVKQMGDMINSAAEKIYKNISTSVKSLF